MNPKGWLFLIILCSPILAVMSVLHLKQRSIRYKVKKEIIVNLEDDDLSLLILSEKEASSLQWKESHEFVYRGEYYDVVRSKKSQDSVFYWCYKDDNETQIARQIEQAMSQFWLQNTQDQRKNKEVELIFKHLFCEALNSPSLPKYGSLEKQEILSLPELISEPFLEKNYPPPQLCS